MNIQRRAHGITARVSGKTCQFGVSEVREEGVVFEGSSLALTQFFYACKSRGEVKGSHLGFFLHYATFHSPKCDFSEIFSIEAPL